MFRHPVAIEPADIDHMGHVNNAVYLKWVQEAVVDYWSSVAPPERRRPASVGRAQARDHLPQADLPPGQCRRRSDRRKGRGRPRLLPHRRSPRRGSAERDHELLVLPRCGEPAPCPPRPRHRRPTSCRPRPNLRCKSESGCQIIRQKGGGAFSLQTSGLVWVVFQYSIRPSCAATAGKPGSLKVPRMLGYQNSEGPGYSFVR